MNRIIANVLLTAVLSVAVVAALYTVNRLAAPQPKILPDRAASAPDPARILAEISEPGIAAILHELEQCGSRGAGAESASRASRFIAGQLESFGYRLIRQPVRVTVPVTVHAVVHDENGDVLPGIEIFPMLPNKFRTATTPPEGLTGTCYAGEFGLSREFRGVPVRDNFVMLPIGVAWSTLAGMGAKAVFYYDKDDNPRSAKWAHHVKASVNVPRFYVRGDVQSLAGRRITVKATVEMREVIAENLIAVLDSPASGREALLIGGFYDAMSYVPDLAVGASQATNIPLILQTAGLLAAERDAHKRKVVVVFTGAHCQALAGAREILDAVGVSGDILRSAAAAARQRNSAERTLATVQEAERILLDNDYWNVASEAGEEAYWRPYPAELRNFVEETVVRVIDVDHMAANERMVQARTQWIRAGMPVSRADAPVESFEDYNDARLIQQRAKILLSIPLGRLKSHPEYNDLLRSSAFQNRARSELERRSRHCLLEKQAADARLELTQLFGQFERLIYLGVDSSAASGRLGLITSEKELAPHCIPADTEVTQQFLHAARDLTSADTDGISYEQTRAGSSRFVNLVRAQDALSLPFASGQTGAGLYFDSSAFLAGGYTAFTLVTLDDNRAVFGTPHDTFGRILSAAENLNEATDLTPLANLTIQARLIAAACSRIARGHAQLVPVSNRGDLYAVNGRVVSQIGENLTPNQIMPDALVRMTRLTQLQNEQPPGVLDDFYASADWNGDFRISALWVSAIGHRYNKKVNIDAALVDWLSGDITWALSEPKSGINAPFSVRGVPLPKLRDSLATAVVFRCAPVQVFPMPDPNTMRAYAGFDFLLADNLAKPQEYFVESGGGAYVCFVPPETRLYFTFKKGTKSSPNLMEIRAFALNAGAEIAEAAASASGIDGEGYLAADNPVLINIELDAAASMARVNAARVRLQEKYDMADRLVLAYNEKAAGLARTARDQAARNELVEAKHSATKSLAYSTNIHPVIRKNASDAIVGILFYLFLAIFFSVFMEKLLVGHPDIRYQLVYQGLIFLTFFVLLRVFHPAYQLVRSSYMILLGFITLTLACSVGAFVSGRFSRNISQMHRRMRNEVETADVSRAGAATTAFLLGLNNLRKRPVRTALTMGTLVLITFVMICFTSVSTDLADIEFPVGKANYNGLLMRDRAMRTVETAYGPLREFYGEDHIVAPRAWAGNFIFTQTAAPELASYVVSRSTDAASYEARVHAIIGLTPEESKVLPIMDVFHTIERWFDEADEESCFLPRSVADSLHIAEQDLGEREVFVKISGKSYRVLGIFDEAALDNLLDLDGESLVPINLLAMQAPTGMEGTAAEADTDEAAIPEGLPRLSASQILITPYGNMPVSRERVASVAVALKGVDYAQARQILGSHLERTGEPAYYGVDGVAFFGGKFRMQSMEGLLDLILPIIISALTVLNTMRGSVYERRSELYVFNAVGLAPNHIRFLFLAEACVYAVVGAVGGYLLAQITGSMLKWTGLTGGLTMNYSSLSAVVVSIIIMTVVFISSFFPARMAARLAAPAETMSRARETTQGDVLELDLPFTFNRRDRVAIIPYFVDWLQNYGEGSSGEFFCSEPETGIRQESDGSVSPYLRTTSWLKPYDLGVSQQLDLVVRHDLATGDNVATVIMTRKSGDRDSWERCCYGFIGFLRKRFLTWRAVTDEDRALLLERARKMLDPKNRT